MIFNQPKPSVSFAVEPGQVTEWIIVYHLRSDPPGVWTKSTHAAYAPEELAALVEILANMRAAGHWVRDKRFRFVGGEIDDAQILQCTLTTTVLPT